MRRALWALLVLCTGCPTDQPAAKPDLATAKVDAAVVARVTTPEVLVSEVSGIVEAQTKSGTRQVQKGDKLSVDDRVQTKTGGRAKLIIGELAEIEVSEETQLAISALAEKLSRIRIGEGRLRAVVHGRGSATLRIEAEGSNAAAEAGAGTFSMLSDGKGHVSVAAEEGNVDLTANDKTVSISAGELSIVRGTAPPSAPMKIPATLFLKVGAPGAHVRRSKRATVTGTSTPGAIVSINGVVTTADDKGSFSAEVDLKDGANAVSVRSSDVLGRTTTQALPKIVVDTKAPKVQTEVEW